MARRPPLGADMEREELATSLGRYFPGVFGGGAPTLPGQDFDLIVGRLLKMDREPLGVTHFNQLLHLVHEAGVTPGFFEYYFTEAPSKHPYPVSKVTAVQPPLAERVSSLAQLEWGLQRFFTDALLFFGTIRTGFRELRVKTHEQLEAYFGSRRFPTALLASRDVVLPFNKIPVDDRYLIAEIACKAYSIPKEGGLLVIEELLVDAFRKSGSKRVRLGALFEKDSTLHREDPQGQLLLNFAADELRDAVVEDESAIRARIASILPRFERARKLALDNTRLYLSVVNELDIYVATSMRTRDDFRNMARDCQDIFAREELKRLRLRYFDPTMSAAEGHEDKGLIECLMVKCCRALLYFAGTGDSFGKDAEVAMAMSLGKPVIILCPDDQGGIQRERFFRDIHPLSRLIEFETGIACGAIVTRNRDTAATLLQRIFENTMEYDVEHDGDGYFRLRERVTRSVVRLQTSDKLIRETFWNYYHGVQ